MRLQLHHLAAALALLSFAGTQARAVDIYVLSGSSTGGTNVATGFGKIDSATGAYTQISAAVSGTTTVTNLAWNAAISAFYVTENVTAASVNLRTLDTSGTLSSTLGLIGTRIYGMAYRSTDSTLYAYGYPSDTTGTINPANGTWSELNASSGIVGWTPTGGRYTMHNDTIYASVRTYDGDTEIYSGSLGTFGYTASSTFNQIGADDLYRTMVLASDGTTLYGVFGNGTAGSQKLYSINTNTGVPTLMSNVTGSGLGNYFYGAAAGVTPVPEPSTYALAAIATGVMAYVARRRKGRQA